MYVFTANVVTAEKRFIHGEVVKRFKLYFLCRVPLFNFHRMDGLNCGRISVWNKKF